jgi:hypothetical protein
VGVAVSRPVRTPPGGFAPLPAAAQAGIVLAVHSLESGMYESPHAAACRAYVSQGLASPDTVLSPLGWLIDVAA